MNPHEVRWRRALAVACVPLVAGFGDWIGARLQKEEAE